MERLVAVMGSVSAGVSKDLFHLQVPWEEKVIRAVVVYAFLLLALRLFGRRELGQFTALDLVVLLTLSNHPAERDDRQRHLAPRRAHRGNRAPHRELRTRVRGVPEQILSATRHGGPRILIRDGVVQKQALAA